MMHNVNQQALKSLSCFFAVTFFSTSRMCTDVCFLHANVMSVFYFLSLVSKPLFFMIIGYMDEVDKVTKQEARLKIKSLLIMLVFWNLIFLFLNLDMIKKGYLLQNGILFSVVIIYLLYPLVLKGMSHIKWTILTFVALIAVSLLVDVVNMVTHEHTNIFLPDYYSLWIWPAYYIFGRLLGTGRGGKVTKEQRVALWAKVILVPAAVSMYFYEQYLSTHAPKETTPWFLLEHAHLVVLSLCLFIWFDNLVIRNGLVRHIVAFISPAMVGVYIVHYSVFYFITTLYDFNYATLKFTLLILVFLSSVIISRLLLMNKFTSKFITF